MTWRLCIHDLASLGLDPVAGLLQNVRDAVVQRFEVCFHLGTHLGGLLAVLPGFFDQPLLFCGPLFDPLQHGPEQKIVEQGGEHQKVGDLEEDRG